MTTATLGRPATKSEQSFYYYRMIAYHREADDVEKWHGGRFEGDSGHAFFCRAEFHHMQQRCFERLLKELERR